MLDSLNDEFIITGHIEEGTTSSRIGEFNQWLTTKGVLKMREDIKSQTCQGLPYGESRAIHIHFKD